MRPILLASIVAALLPSSVAAQTGSPAGELVGRIKSGDTVYVLDPASRETTGVLGKVSDSGLTMMVDGQVRDIPFSDIRRITRRGGDPLWNGTLVGAAIGGLANGLAQGPRYGIAGAILYGGIGALIDSLVDGRVVVYRAPKIVSMRVTPMFGQERGVRVVVKF